MARALQLIAAAILLTLVVLPCTIDAGNGFPCSPEDPEECHPDECNERCRSQDPAHFVGICDSQNFPHPVCCCRRI
ncbi:hypothetical protein BDA96_05G203600 [Sorghum bicolor]|uniref:Knottin scorpion toxin-like domain-containing protein n=2 Tax=Sorghum bicolor TaxID=4558 RepID=A0A921UGE2_SORBI|nr:hypothetical protein BDA96_05G203600 [Sorghum bicolor]KXG28937.1 hypothetical protein SORBI_3005G187100 [Sorghum bicolor]